MDQAQVNESEWHDAANWNHGFYFSKKDSRVWVPKQIRAMGWTINLGHPHGPTWLMSILIGILLLVVAISAITVATTG